MIASSGKDTMASYVKQLLELDEGRRRATLESLSKYELKEMDSEAGAAAAARNGAEQPKVYSSKDPQKVNIASMNSQPGRMEMKLEPLLVQMTPSGIPCAKEPYTGAAAQFISIDEKTPPKRILNTVEKALINISKNPPAEAVRETQDILKAISGQVPCASPPGQQPRGHDEALKWLAQHIEKQQKESVQRLAKLLGADWMLPAAAANYGMTGPMRSQPLPPPGLGAAAAALHGRMPAVPAPEFAPIPRGCQPLWNGANCMQMQQPPVQPGFARADRGVGKRMHAQPLQGGMLRRRGSPAAADTTEGSSTDANGSTPEHPAETLRMHLRYLLKIDSSRILLVRKINRLGFASPDVLAQHYSWYGTVERVLVAHSRVKSCALTTQAGSNLASRLRPSGLGFIVMSTPEEVKTILAVGTEQLVCGAMIRVQPFERRITEMHDGQGNEELTADTNEPDTNDTNTNDTTSEDPQST